MSTASTASMGLLTSSRQQPRRDDDIGSLCRNASPSRKGAFSSSVVVSANAQHARFIATTIYRTCGIVVTSARLTTHSSGPSSFYPTLGVCLGPNRPRRCRRGGRSSIIGDAWISEGRRSVAASHSRVSRSMACGDGCGPGDACADGLATLLPRLMGATGPGEGPSLVRRPLLTANSTTHLRQRLGQVQRGQGARRRVRYRWRRRLGASHPPSESAAAAATRACLGDGCYSQ